MLEIGRGRRWRLRKYLRHLLSGHRTGSRAVFIFGCQRSGTTMLLRTLDRSMATWVYPEVDRRAFDESYRIRSFKRIDGLIRNSRASVVAFKPMCDSHRADVLLSDFAHHDARALWIYRGYPDVVNSLVEKWGDHLASVMRTIAAGRRDEVGWRGERLGPERLEEIDRLLSEGISAEEGAAMFWYLRNRFFFDLGLSSSRRVLLVNYERLVNDPTRYLPRVFRFLHLRFDPEFGGHIHADAVGKRPPPTLSTDVESACIGLLTRLEERHAQASRPAPGQRRLPETEVRA